MAKHLCDAEYITLPTALELLDLYRRGLSCGLSDRMAKKYAVRAKESMRQGSSWLPSTETNRRKPLWMGNSDKNAKVETFNRLVKRAIGSVPNKNTMKAASADVVLNSLKKYKPEDYRPFQEANDNFISVTGLKVWYGTGDFLTIPTLLAWRSVKRGRDLFIKGFGSFDIPNAVEAVRNRYVTVLPYYIRSEGYGIHNPHFFVQLDRYRFLKRYAIRHVKWIRENPARVDELLYSARIISLFPDISPENAIHRHQEPTMIDFPKCISELPIKETSCGVLRPLRSARECVEVGREMRNCASRYIVPMAAGEVLLVGLFRDNKPVGLGELRYGVIGDSPYWNQILGIANQRLSKHEENAFELYPVKEVFMKLEEKED